MAYDLKKIGDSYKGFTLTKKLPIQELQCTLVELIHEPTGAQVMHIDCNDEENLFCINFPTIPYNSNGVAHILEHTVLCGSKKFPVKDPFFSMSRRSLHTFMNAMTGSDFTCYPASSQNEKDFYNLLEVYLDATFNPLLKKMSFLQEGHRLEFTEPADPSTPLQFKGIVYNEMKGAMSSADARLWQHLFEHLTPNLPYAYNSGGDPFVIPSLSHQELLDFHKTHYHPSLAQFFFYGNFPLKKHLDFIEAKALKGVTKISKLPPIGEQPLFSSPKYAVESYPVSEDERLENKSVVSFSWLVTKATHVEEVLLITLLDQILMGTDASPLKSALLESDLCTQADAYLDTDITQVPWVIVCKGCNEEKIETLQKVLMEAIHKITQEEIPQKLIESALHQVEFSRSEITSDSNPFGLTLFFRSVIPKMYGAEPENALMIHSHFKKIREKTKDPLFLPNLIKKYFLDNPHFLRLHLKPSKTLLNEEYEKEQNLLKTIQEKLTDSEKKAIVLNAQELDIFQKQQENESIECLPKITIKDVSSEIKDYSLENYHQDNLDVFYHECFTNKIVYADIFFDLPNIENDDLTYLSLFQTLLTDLGAKEKSYQQTLEYMQEYTGGVDASISLHIQADNPRNCKPTFCLRGKALYRNTEKLFAILKDFLTAPKVEDPKRIKQLLLQLNSHLEAQVNRNAMQYAVLSSLSGLSPCSYVYNQWHGLPFFKLIKFLVQDIDQGVALVIKKFKEFVARVLNIHQMHLVLACDREHFESIKSQNFFQVNDIKSREITPWNNDFSVTPVFSHSYELALPVAFTSMAYKAVGFTDKHSPHLLIATHLMENLVLHNAIREIGGAYGSGATYSPTSGHFYFYAYRDPHIKSSQKAFEKAINFIAEENFSEDQLEEAKLGVIQSIDSPISPGSRAVTAYIWQKAGKTSSMRKDFRKKVLQASKKDITEAVKTCLSSQESKGILVTFAGPNLLKKELNESFPRFKI